MVLIECIALLILAIAVVSFLLSDVSSCIHSIECTSIIFDILVIHWSEVSETFHQLITCMVHSDDCIFISPHI